MASARSRSRPASPTGSTTCGSFRSRPSTYWRRASANSRSRTRNRCELTKRRRITRVGRFRVGWLLVGWQGLWHRLGQGFVRLATIRFRPAHLKIGRRRRTRRPVRTAFPVGIHDPKIMLRVLIQVFGRYSVAAGRCFARKGNITFEHLIRVAADLYVWAVAVESLGPLGHPRAVVVPTVP